MDNSQYESKMDELIVAMDECVLAVREHSYVIRENRVDLDQVIAGQKALSEGLKAHVDEENETLKTVATFLRDLKGLDRLSTGIGKIGKWAVIIGGPTGLVVTYWDKIVHAFIKGWP